LGVPGTARTNIKLVAKTRMFIYYLNAKSGQKFTLDIVSVN